MLIDNIRCAGIALISSAVLLLNACGGSAAGEATALAEAAERKTSLMTPATRNGSVPAARALFGAAGTLDQLDLNGDGKADLLWYESAAGMTTAWLMDGASLRGGRLLLDHPSYQVIGTPDLDGDGKSDLVWYSEVLGGTLAWLMDGDVVRAEKLLLVDAFWRPIAAPDLNGDGKDDLLWHNASTGATSAWLMNGLLYTSAQTLLSKKGTRVVALPDLNADARTDLVWYDEVTGRTSAWLMGGLSVVGQADLLTDANFKPIASPDLDGDGKSDLLWYGAATGETAAWLMDGLNYKAARMLLTHPSLQVSAVADLNGDRKSDLLWFDSSSGTTAVWQMNGLEVQGFAALLTHPSFRVTGMADLDGDGRADLQWFDPTTGQTAVWLMNGVTRSSGQQLLQSTQVQPVSSLLSTPIRFSVAGTLNGLRGVGLVLGLQAQRLQVASGQSSFAFPVGLTAGTGFEVFVQTQPSGQNCRVVGGTGTVGNGNVTSVQVVCTDLAPRMVSVGGSITHLATVPNGTQVRTGSGSTGLILTTNGIDQAVAVSDGSFAFVLPEGSTYSIVVRTHPGEHDCKVEGVGQGVVGATAITNANVRCLEAMRNPFGEFDPNFGGGDSGAAGAGGSAGDGRPIVGAKVEVYGTVGNLTVRSDATRLTDSFGRFSVRVEGLAPPLVAVVYDPASGNSVPKWYALTMQAPVTRGFITLNLSGLTDALVSGVNNNFSFCGSSNTVNGLMNMVRTSPDTVPVVAQRRSSIRTALVDRIRSWERETQTIPADFDPVTTLLNINPPNFYDRALDNMAIVRAPGSLTPGAGNNFSPGSDPSCKTQVRPIGGLSGTPGDF